MYYFKFHGADCSCDTADELKSALVMPKIMANVGSEATPEKKPRKKSKRKYSRAAKVAKASNTDAVKKLPFIQGGINWDVANRVAKQVGRTDVAQVRSDLKTRQRMGK